jgi:hypothetical protein
MYVTALAGRSARAAEYPLRAGDRARGLYAHQEAIDSCERALAFLGQGEDDDRAAFPLLLQMLLAFRILGVPCYRQVAAPFDGTGTIAPIPGSEGSPQVVQRVFDTQHGGMRGPCVSVIEGDNVGYGPGSGLPGPRANGTVRGDGRCLCPD